MAKLTASKLRADIYKILDQVARTGKPVDIVRGDAVLSIVAKAGAHARKQRKLSRLKRRKLADGDSDQFEHIDWTSEWKKGA